MRKTILLGLVLIAFVLVTAARCGGGGDGGGSGYGIVGPSQLVQVVQLAQPGGGR